MNWKQRLFKPKWEHKDADIRLAAVSSEQDPQLINSLLEIAAGDDDTRVRCAAIKRLHQLQNILKLYENETDKLVKTLLEDRIRQLSTSSDESRPALELRLQVINSTTDRKLIEQLASHGPEASLRHAALARVERQGLLGDCCIHDSDPENRRFAASRITQQATLKRVIEGLRKRDKALYTQLQQRLHEELLDNADPAAVQSEALHICTALEQHAIEAGTDKDTQAITALHLAWQRIAAITRPDMLDRYQRICARLEAPATVKAVAEKPTVEATPEPEPESDIQTEPEKPPAVTPAPQTREATTQAHTQCQAARAEQRKQREQDLETASALLMQLGEELEQGELHKGLETRAKIQQLAKGQGRHKGWQQLNRRMAGMQARLRELRDWLHWSNNKIRKRLIAEMEVLPAADLHPDALLDRVKSLQAEWKTLEQSEQIPGDKHFASAPWMWRKFSAAGHTAFDTAKPFLEKRSEIQSRHAQSLATFCAELEQLTEQDPQDSAALARAINLGHKKLHDLNSVPAKQRQAFARQLKAALDKANQVQQQGYQAIETEKMKLIRAASQLIHLPDRTEAIAQAKSLQSSWKAAGRVWRSKEQALWEQFRAHLDPLFEELKAQQETLRAADAERLAIQKSLCEELQTILKSNDDLAARHGIVQGLQDSWKEVRHPDRKLLASFQRMMEDYEQQVKHAQVRQANVERERWWLKSALLHEWVVSGATAKLQKAWPEASSEKALEVSMDEACAAILDGGADSGNDTSTAEDLTAQARLLCIQLEFIAGLQSPDEDRDLRMRYQVDRLAESMSGKAARQPVLEEAAEAEKAWLGMYALPASEFDAFGKRVKLALSAIRETN